MVRLLTSLCLAAVLSAGCSRAPGADGLRDSFAAQLAANKFVSGFTRNGDDMTFNGPRPDGEPASWRVHIDRTSVEAQDTAGQPYKGVVTSSWYVDGQPVKPSGSESNLPLELTSNGLGQECWAFWDAGAQRWSWE
jgi:hypothetical protein